MAMCAYIPRADADAAAAAAVGGGAEGRGGGAGRDRVRSTDSHSLGSGRWLYSQRFGKLDDGHPIKRKPMRSVVHRPIHL